MQETNAALANSDEFLGELLKRLETDSDQDWSFSDFLDWRNPLGGCTLDFIKSWEFGTSQHHDYISTAARLPWLGRRGSDILKKHVAAGETAKHWEESLGAHLRLHNKYIR